MHLLSFLFCTHFQFRNVLLDLGNRLNESEIKNIERDVQKIKEGRNDFEMPKTKPGNVPYVKN